MKKAKRIILYILIFAFIILPICFAIGTLISLYQNDTHGEFVKLTSYGFAIFASVSTMLFSWARALEAKESVTIKKLNNSGVNSLMCAIFLLCSNLIKYVNNVPESTFPAKFMATFAQSNFFGFITYPLIIAVEVISITIIIEVGAIFIDTKLNKE